VSAGFARTPASRRVAGEACRCTCAAAAAAAAV